MQTTLTHPVLSAVPQSQRPENMQRNLSRLSGGACDMRPAPEHFGIKLGEKYYSDSFADKPKFYGLSTRVRLFTDRAEALKVLAWIKSIYPTATIVPLHISVKEVAA